MNDEAIKYASKLIPATYVQQGIQSLQNRENAIRHLIEQRKLPKDGWDNSSIEYLIQVLSMMDSNNFPTKCGVGERESRIVSEIVARRYFRMGHGIGRSGDVTEVQPKAAGSSLMNKITNSMMLDVIHICGVQDAAACFVVPMATGMSMTLVLLTLRQQRPLAKYVIWPRIDQKSCFKSIITAGYQPVIIQEKLVGDELQTDTKEIDRKIEELGEENVLCILSTTSCFAPRSIDNLIEISRLCKLKAIPHVVNNAYGLQSTKCMHLIQQSFKTGGRLDAFVQSTDKNLMVPVGGSVIASFDIKMIDAISKMYPGRASSGPSLDVFITLLTLGSTNYLQFIKDRKNNFIYLKSQMEEVAAKNGERILVTPNNPISLAMSLTNTCGTLSYTEVGAMLFTRGVSGTRVVQPDELKNISGYSFNGFGSHHDNYPCAYLTAAAAIGITKNDVDVFIKKLDKVIKTWKQRKFPVGGAPCSHLLRKLSRGYRKGGKSLEYSVQETIELF